MAEAGYANGFGLTIYGPNDRYLNDEKVVQAVAQMFARAGINAKVATMSKSIYFSKAAAREFSVFLVGTSTDTGEASDMMKFILGTYNQDKGIGAGNRGRFSDPEYDRLLQEALITIDDGKREKLLQRATERGIGELVGIVPLQYTVNTWAARKGLTLVPRFDELTLATEIKPAP